MGRTPNSPQLHLTRKPVPSPSRSTSIWVIGGNVSMVYLDGFSEKRALGVTYANTEIYVDGDMANVSCLPDNLRAGSILHTIAHEIGHVMSDKGHPGEPLQKSTLV